MAACQLTGDPVTPTENYSPSSEEKSKIQDVICDGEALSLHRGRPENGHSSFVLVGAAHQAIAAIAPGAAPHILLTRDTSGVLHSETARTDDDVEEIFKSAIRREKNVVIPGATPSVPMTVGTALDVEGRLGVLWGTETTAALPTSLSGLPSARHTYRAVSGGFGITYHPFAAVGWQYYLRPLTLGVQLDLASGATGSGISPAFNRLIFGVTLGVELTSDWMIGLFTGAARVLRPPRTFNVELRYKAFAFSDDVMDTTFTPPGGIDLTTAHETTAAAFQLHEIEAGVRFYLTDSLALSTGFYTVLGGSIHTEAYRDAVNLMGAYVKFDTIGYHRDAMYDPAAALDLSRCTLQLPEADSAQFITSDEPTTVDGHRPLAPSTHRPNHSSTNRPIHHPIAPDTKGLWFIPQPHQHALRVAADHLFTHHQLDTDGRIVFDRTLESLRSTYAAQIAAGIAEQPWELLVDGFTDMSGDYQESFAQSTEEASIGAMYLQTHMQQANALAKQTNNPLPFPERIAVRTRGFGATSPLLGHRLDIIFGPVARHARPVAQTLSEMSTAERDTIRTHDTQAVAKILQPVQQQKNTGVSLATFNPETRELHFVVKLDWVDGHSALLSAGGWQTLHRVRHVMTQHAAHFRALSSEVTLRVNVIPNHAAREDLVAAQRIELIRTALFKNDDILHGGATAVELAPGVSTPDEMHNALQQPITAPPEARLVDTVATYSTNFSIGAHAGRLFTFPLAGNPPTTIAQLALLQRALGYSVTAAQHIIGVLYVPPTTQRAQTTRWFNTLSGAVLNAANAPGRERLGFASRGDRFAIGYHTNITPRWYLFLTLTDTHVDEGTIAEALSRLIETTEK